MVAAEVAGTGAAKPLTPRRLGGKADEINPVRQSGIDIVEVVADVDDTVLRQAGGGDGAGHGPALVPAAFGTERQGRDLGPQARRLESEARGGKQIGGGYSGTDANACGRDIKQTGAQRFPPGVTALVRKLSSRTPR